MGIIITNCLPVLTSVDTKSTKGYANTLPMMDLICFAIDWNVGMLEYLVFYVLCRNMYYTEINYDLIEFLKH